MKKLHFVILLVVYVLSSCARNTYQTIGTAKPEIKIITDTVHTTLKINKQKKIEGSAVYSSILIFTVKAPTNFAENEKNELGSNLISNLKNAAIRDALNNNNMEYLISPKFDIIIKKTLISKEILVRVEGYGATMHFK